MTVWTMKAITVLMMKIASIINSYFNSFKALLIWQRKRQGQFGKKKNVKIENWFGEGQFEKNVVYVESTNEKFLGKILKSGFEK
jgi:hypothetical protein